MLNPQHQIKILIVDDDDDDYFIIREYINDIEAGKFIIEWCRDFGTALQHIRSKNFEIYLVDYRLGNETGLQLLKQAVEAGCEEPIIMLTGKGNKAIDIEAMKLGATDYLVKPDLNTEKLERCIRYAIERSSNIKSLRQSEKKYKNLFESSKDAVFIADDSLAFKELNPAACLLLQSGFSEISQPTLYDYIIDPQQRSIIKKALLTTEIIHDFEVTITTSKNESKHCLLSLTIETEEKQTFIHGIIHDITNLKHAENIKLQVEKFAANERLISIIAHEVRNPLTNISLAVDQLMTNMNEQNALFMHIIKRNTIRINQLIKELLDFAKSVELTTQKIAIQEIIEKSLDNSDDRLKLQNIRINKKYPQHPLFIMADNSKLIIALSNIIINAIESMEKNKGELTINIEEQENNCNLIIKDNGKGIPEEYLARISEPFFTLKRNGMGIGLASTFMILRSHKAHVHVESQIDIGTNFIINFETIKE